MSKSQFKRLSLYGKLYTIYEFIDGYNKGCFSKLIGYGYYVNDGNISTEMVDFNNINMNYTHILWFNKK